MFKNQMTSEELKEIRKEKNLSQSEFAMLLGVSTITIKSWENKRRSIPKTINNFLRLSIINCPSDKLLEIIDNIQN